MTNKENTNKKKVLDTKNKNQSGNNKQTNKNNKKRNINNEEIIKNKSNNTESKNKVKKDLVENNKVNENKKVKSSKKTIEDYSILKPIKKKERKRQFNKKIIFIVGIFILSLVICSFLYFSFFKIEKEPFYKYDPEPEFVINYEEYYHEQVKLLSNKNIYKLVDGVFQSIGIIYKDYVLELISDEYLKDGYFKLKDMDYYIDYKDIVFDDTNLKTKKETYLNYVPFNESIETIDETNFYLNDNLYMTISEGMQFAVSVKEDDYYGVIYQNKLFYIKKEECTLFKQENTNLKHTNGIATLVYHFTYDSTNEEEKKNCRNTNVTICLSDNLFKKHLLYLKENNFYTATMEDLSLFIDGKVQLPEKTVVITIDDGYFVNAAIKVLEELDMQATLFLIGEVGSPENYQSDNLEIHSHTYSLHYPGACSGGQGSPLKCLKREKILDDLKKSREQLNGSTVFCYPFFEYNDYAINILKEAGFEMAFIGGRRKIRVGSNKYKLPRYGIINTTTVSDIKNIVN